MRSTPRGTRKVADTIVGYLLICAGIVMLATPGPGIVTIIAGLALLARHYHWAERVKAAALARIRDAGTRLRASRAVSARSPDIGMRMTEPADERETA